MIDINEMVAFLIMANADILFPNCKFSIGLVSTFKYDDDPMLKHLCMDIHAW